MKIPLLLNERVMQLFMWFFFSDTLFPADMIIELGYDKQCQLKLGT